MLLNDRLHDIEHDEKFGAKVAEAVQRDHMTLRKKPQRRK